MKQVLAAITMDLQGRPALGLLVLPAPPVYLSPDEALALYDRLGHLLDVLGHLDREPEPSRGAH